MRVYRLLLRAFPSAFRARFGDDMVEVFTDRLRAARRRGRTAALAFWARTVADVLAHGVAVRRGNAPVTHPPGRRSMLSSLAQDVRHALRSFRRRPGLTAIALVTLALGIGANTAVFTVVHAVLLRGLPYPDADGIVRVYATHRKYDFDHGVLNPFDVTYLQERATSIETLALDVSCRSTLTGAGDPERLRCAMVTPSFFDVMRTRPEAGRVFTADEAREDAHVVVLSHALWTTRFGRRPDVVGSTVTLDDEAWRVVGIMPPAFAFPQDVRLWKPFALTPAQRADMGSWFLGGLARIAPGRSVADARAELTRLGADLEAAYPARRTDRGFHVVDLRTDLGSRAAEGLRLLQGVALFVLLIACANVANLRLAQASARRQEFGVRAALGGSRWRLARQSLTESVLLALAGAAFGTVIAIWGVGVLVAMAPPYTLPTPETIGVRWPVLAVTAAAAGLTGLLFGLAPALVASSAAVARGLGSGTRELAGGLSWARRQRLRASLVAGEVALAIVLLAGAGLLIRSFETLLGQAPGFRPDHLLTAQVTLPRARYETPESRLGFWRDLTARLRALPGVTDAAGSNALPFSLWEWQTGFTVVGREDVPNEGAGSRTVTPGYFETLGIPVLAGRTFTAADVASSEPVAVVSDVFVRLHMAGLAPVGQRIRTSKDEPPITIVGVVGATRHLGLDEAPRAEIYQPLAQVPDTSTLLLALRTTGDPDAVAPGLRAAVTGLDPALPVEGLTTMEGLLGNRLAERRFYVTLLSLFAALALALAATGIYGVMAFVVAQGRREIGIRLALGARPSQVRRRVVRQGLLVVGLGAAVGLVGARWLSGLLEARLFETSTGDPATYATAAIGLLAVATLACWIPARRTSAVDPAGVLRD
ncbi:MAG: ABC transporter permease [Vicinamibacterales bacterium]